MDRTIVETAAIRYRVVDFLTKHPPFQTMAEQDLLDLAQLGRVRFFEKNEFLLSQGAMRFEILIVQQGMVSVWDETGTSAVLRDIRGAGDMLGIDRFKDSRSHLYSATAASDVLVYAFPTDEFEELIQKHPYALQYVAAYGGVTLDPQRLQRQNPEDIFLHSLVAHKELRSCAAATSIREAAQYMLATGAEAIAVLDSGTHKAMTTKSFLEWIAAGGGDVREPIGGLAHSTPEAISASISVTDAVLAMSSAPNATLMVTSRGTADSELRAIVSPKDLVRVFGDQPVAILEDIRRASNTSLLRELNNRARAFALQYLIAAGSVDWLTRFVSLVDLHVVRRIIALEGCEESQDCWCLCESAGRKESLVNVAPKVLLILKDGSSQSRSLRAYQRVLQSVGECGYLPGTDSAFQPSFYAADLAEWKKRYNDWIQEPVLNQILRARPLFDLAPMQGQALWQEVEWR